jgi:hypothetical protein
LLAFLLATTPDRTITKPAAHAKNPMNQTSRQPVFIMARF